MAGQRSEQENSHLLDLNERNLGRAIAWVSVVDSKAKFVLAVDAVILGYAASRFSGLWPTMKALWATRRVELCVALTVLLAAVACLIISSYFLVRVIYPKRTPHTLKGSYFYFETIAMLPSDNFISKMKQMPLCEAVEGIADQTYNVSKVVVKKFNELATSINWLGGAFGAFLIFCVLYGWLLAS